MRGTSGTDERGGRLSARELDVLRLVAAGQTNVAIAHHFGVSPRTVAKHLEHSYRKLGVSCRSAAVAQTADLIRR
jgi:DNA-binding CsgD family transcriptional regulator